MRFVASSAHADLNKAHFGKQFSFPTTYIVYILTRLVVTKSVLAQQYVELQNGLGCRLQKGLQEVVQLEGWRCSGLGNCMVSFGRIAFVEHRLDGPEYATRETINIVGREIWKFRLAIKVLNIFCCNFESIKLKYRVDLKRLLLTLFWIILPPCFTKILSFKYLNYKILRYVYKILLE